MYQKVWDQFFEPTGAREQMADRARIERSSSFVATRVGAQLAIAILLLLVPFEASSNERFFATGVAVCVAILSAVIEFKVPARRIDLAQTALTIAGIMGIVSQLPVLWMSGFVIAAIATTAAIPLQSRNITLALLVLVTVGMGAIGWATDVQEWFLPVIGAITVIPTIESFYRQWREQRVSTDRRYDALVEAAGLFFWEFDVENRELISITGQTEVSLGLSRTALLQRSWDEIFTDDSIDLDQVAAAATTDNDSVLFFHLGNADGEPVAFRHVIRRGDRPGVLHGAAMEITELENATRTIRHQAEHDSLTGLSNRAVLNTELVRTLEQRKPREEVALLMLDLNRFKEVNDTLGHPVGDELLKVLALRFQNSIDADVVARLGGDEFAFLATGVDSLDAVAIAGDISKVTEDFVRLNGLTLSVSASIGLAMAPEDGVTAEELMKHADIAMYEAKRRGVQVVRYSATPDDLSVERLRLSSEITSALEGGEIELWFQPKVNLKSKEIVGAEGLARWCHPSLGVLTPDRFLGLLMMSGNYRNFTDEMIHHAIRFAARCQTAGKPMEISVNLSAMSFFDHELPYRIASLLEVHGVEPELLTLEITESDMLDDLSVHLPTFERLAQLGVGLSIDDFGIGHSSLSRLRTLPVGEVKIDRSFVMGMTTEPEDLIIVRAIVDLASILGHETVAEGVETEEAAEMLCDLGCHVAQGYLFGRAEPADEFMTRLDVRSTSDSLPVPRLADRASS